jgi:hypothetical protein
MIHSTIDGKFETAAEAIADVTINQLVGMQQIGDRFPVCVCCVISPRKTYYGVQFWTKEEIEQGESVNTDKTISKICNA